MKNSLAAFAVSAALIGTGGAAQSQDEFTLQLKWLTQAQFAGYFVAQEKGFYEDVGLDVTIRPGGPDIAPPQVLAAGGADVMVDWMPSALAARERGVPLVNVAQVFDRSGMMLTCDKDSGITSPEDFPGHTLGVWFAGNEYPFLSWMDKLGYSTSGPDADVTVLRQGFNVDPLLQGQADCISTMIYNEYWQLIDAGMTEDELITFFYEDQGVATLEDGLYVLEENLEDPEFVDKLSRFIAASMKGWQYAIDNVEESAQIVVDNDPSGAATLEVQARQLENIATLITDPTGKGLGYLDPEAYRRTVDVLMTGESDPVITEDPGEAAWTHGPWEAAMEM
ncbi:ABC transporter substrate-binding protein [Inquilinus sp. CAU 1745]|uniref:ABC transporter substrate-binding protein n=1 Tax=Inquilinus sp. CAU 1745 TaxID=3140369 RepID=UPI00325C11BA